VWLTVHLVGAPNEQRAGVVPPMPEEAPRIRHYTPRTEEPLQGPKFGSQP
jgi:hypothetical protein